MFSFNSQYVLAVLPADTPEIRWDSAEFAMVYVPAGSAISLLTFHVGGEGVHLPLYEGAVAVTLNVAAGRSYRIPALNSCQTFKMEADAAGSVEVSFQGNPKMYSWKANYALTAALATTPEIKWGEAEFGMIYNPPGSPINQLTFYTAPEDGGTYQALFTAAGVAVVLVVAAGRAYRVPVEVQGARALKMVADAAGTVVVSFQGVK